MTTQPSRAPWRRGAVLVPLVLLLLAGAGFGFAQWRAAADAAEARARLLAEVDTAVAKEPIDSDALQRLIAQLKKLPDHEIAPDVLLARARILLARDQAEAAWQLFGAVASAPTASAAAQSLGARILLRVHAAGLSEGTIAAGQLDEVARLAEAAYRESRAPGDLFRAWLACQRAGQTERATAFAKRLASEHADAPERAFVALTSQFDAKKGPAAVDDAVRGLSPVPPEADAMRAFAQMQTGDLAGAARSAEAALARAGGVQSVRWTAAVTFTACALASKEPGERADWVHRRDEQLGWIEHQPGVSDAMKQQCRELRDQK